MSLYRIKDWDTHFENHESRKIKTARWVGLPNKHDGKSYRRVAGHRDAVPVFAAWTLILEVASKMPARGVLADEDGALDASDLSAMTGFPAEIFEKAFKLLTDSKIAWLVTDEPPAISRVVPQPPDKTGETAVEQKGIEGKGIEDKSIVDSDESTAHNISHSRSALATEVFEYWRTELGKNGTAKFDVKRRRLVEARLADNDVEFIKQAIRGIKHSAFHMGENEQHKVYDGLNLICRDQEKLESFAALDEPRRPRATESPPEICSKCLNTGVRTAYDPIAKREVQRDCNCDYGLRRSA